MYAIVKTGGKQYRVEQGQSLLVERLRVEDGGKAELEPLLYVDGDTVVDGEALAKVSVSARVVGQERGPKLRVVKFKPKRGYKRRTGHRQELTRIEVTEIKLAGRRPSSRTAKAAAGDQGPKPVAAAGEGAEAPAPVAAETPKTTRSRAPKKPASKAESASKTGSASKAESASKKTTEKDKPPEGGNGA